MASVARSDCSRRRTLDHTLDFHRWWQIIMGYSLADASTRETEPDYRIVLEAGVRRVLKHSGFRSHSFPFHHFLWTSQEHASTKSYIETREGEDEKFDRACQERPRKSSNCSGPHGRSKGGGRSRNPRNSGRSSAGSRGRGRSRSPRNGGASSGGSRQRHLLQDQQEQQQNEPALWMVGVPFLVLTTAGLFCGPPLKTMVVLHHMHKAQLLAFHISVKFDVAHVIVVRGRFCCSLSELNRLFTLGGQHKHVFMPV